MSDHRARSTRKLDANALWEFALKTLGGRACTTGEMRQKLLKKAQRAEDIAPLLTRLKEYGYLNDKRFAESFAVARLENKGLGKTRVLRDLRARRVAPALASQTVEQVYRGANETALIENFLRRKYRHLEREGAFGTLKDLASAYRKLMNAGFNPGVSIHVLKRFAKEPELLDQFEGPDLPQATEPAN